MMGTDDFLKMLTMYYFPFFGFCMANSLLKRALTMRQGILRYYTGFTLIELVIVIVVIGILAVIAVPIYRGYIKRACASEGKQLLSAIATAQNAYLSEHGSYLTVAAGTSNSTPLSINASYNKFFTSFGVSQSGTLGGSDATFTATTSSLSGEASGISITLIQPWGDAPTITESGY